MSMAQYGTTVNWRMIGLTVLDYGKINDSAMVPDGSGGTTPFERRSTPLPQASISSL